MTTSYVLIGKMKRAQILTTISKATEEPEAFLDLARKHKASKDPFNMTEFLQSLPKKQHCELWDSLLALTAHTIKNMEGGAESEPGGDDATPTSMNQANVSMLLVSGVIEFTKSALDLDEPMTSDPMAQVLQIMHDILLTHFEETPDLQNKASELLETWWYRDMPGKEGVVPNTLLYVMARTLADKAKGCDVKRVWRMRNALLLLDFEDPDTEPFKTMLLGATVHQAYLKTDEGRRFLSFLFGLHPKFVEDLHQTIKNQIPSCSKTLLETYGLVYFRAWRLSSGPYLQQIEEHCLQDLMYSAVHAPRTSGSSLFRSLRKILSYLHQQHSQKGVSAMLLRLYSPFLWRSLKVAHPHVRANAASLLLDAFPLQDPDSTREEVDTVLQKQFDVMMDLLSDSSMIVRVITVSGVCRVLSMYYEMVPFAVMKAILCRLVQELAWDSSAIDVRVAVLQGLCLVLENRLSHPLLKELLPLLHPLLHDKSEKVRLAFLELLLLVKGMRTLKFYHICPTEHLLMRMETDTVHVVKRIVSLLVDAFKPSSSQKIQHCVSLLRLNPGAARRFYQLAGVHLPPGEVVRFILGIRATLLQCIKEAEGGGVAKEGGGVAKGRCRKRKHSLPADEDLTTPTSSNTNEDDNSDQPSELDSKIEEGGWHEQSPTPSSTHHQQPSGVREHLQGAGEQGDESLQDDAPLSLTDSDLMRGLLEVMVVLWEVVRDRLDKPTNRKMKRNLTEKMAQSLPVFFSTFTDGPCQSTLYLLASHLPHASVEPIAQECLRTLTSAQQLSSRTHSHTSLLVALLSWKQTNHVMELTNQWLTPTLVGTDGGGRDGGRGKEIPQRQTRKRSKKGGKKTAESKVTPSASGSDISQQPHDKTSLALDMLSWMMHHPVCMEELKKSREFWNLLSLLKQSMALLTAHHFSPTPSDHPVPEETTPPFPLLKRSLSLYLRLCMHKRLHAAERKGANKEEAWFVGEVQEVLDWSTKVILPHLDTAESVQAAAKPTHRKTKRPRAQATPTPLEGVVKAREVTEEVFGLLSEMLLVRLIAESALECEMAEVASQVIRTASGLSLLPCSCKLLYQLCEGSCDQELEGIPASPGALAPSSTLLSATLSLMQRVSLEDQSVFNKCWTMVSQCIGVSMVSSLHISTSSITPLPQLAPYSALARSVLDSQLQHLVSNSSVEAPSAREDLPIFVQCVLKQVTKDVHSTRLFGRHLCDCVGEMEDLPTNKQLLSHQATLQLVHVLAKDKDGGGEFARCVRCCLKLLEGLSEEDTQRCSELTSDIRTLVEAVQKRLYTRRRKP